MSFSKRILIPLGFTITLLFVRIIMSGEVAYLFLAWNLFLAWLPFAIANCLKTLKTRWKILTVVCLWILFLPNAPYIITDFLHLKHRPPVAYGYDVLLLFSAALNGLLLGILSLLTVEKFLACRYGARVSGLIILSSFFLCAFGIYLGRYLRWNSWDIFLNPGDMAIEIADRILNPLKHFQTWSVTFLFGSFLGVMYYSIKNFILNKSNQF